MEFAGRAHRQLGGADGVHTEHAHPAAGHAGRQPFEGGTSTGQQFSPSSPACKRCL